MDGRSENLWSERSNDWKRLLPSSYPTSRSDTSRQANREHLRCSHRIRQWNCAARYDRANRHRWRLPWPWISRRRLENRCGFPNRKDSQFTDKLFRLRSEEHTSELQSLMRISYAVICLKTKTKNHTRSSLSLSDHIQLRTH